MSREGQQNKNPYDYRHVSNYYPGSQLNNPNIAYPPERQRASQSQYDPHSKKTNIRFVGSVPKYQENEIKPSPQRKIIIVSRKIQDTEEQIMQEVNSHIKNFNPRGISQEPIQQSHKKIRLLNHNYMPPIQSQPPLQYQPPLQSQPPIQPQPQQPSYPPKFKITELKNPEYFNQSRVSQKSSGSNRPISRQQNKDILLQTGSSIFQSALMTQVSQLCQHCNQRISENMVALPCFHYYHEQCFIQLIQGQQSYTKVYCLCKKQISLNPWRNNSEVKIILDKILNNQLQVIRQRYANDFKACKYCIFFWVNQQQFHVAYCPLCLQPANVK